MLDVYFQPRSITRAAYRALAAIPHALSFLKTLKCDTLLDVSAASLVDVLDCLETYTSSLISTPLNSFSLFLSCVFRLEPL